MENLNCSNEIMEGKWLDDEIVSIKLSKNAFKCYLNRRFGGNIETKDAEISLQVRLFLEDLYEKKERLDWTTLTKRYDWGIIRFEFRGDVAYITEIIKQWGKSDKKLLFANDSVRKQYEMRVI